MAKKRSSRRSGKWYAQSASNINHHNPLGLTLGKALRRSDKVANSSRSLAFEVLEGRRMLAADFGDAPDPYATLLVDDGARHEAVGLQLGALRTTEADGVPSLNADADVSDDGVTFGSIRVGQLDATVTVNVQNLIAGAVGKLDAWIDFNGDGSWGGPSEQIFASQDVVLGDNVLEFDVPSWSRSSETIVRFRLSTEGGLGPAGSVADGEVEDYLVVIGSPNLTPAIFYEAGYIAYNEKGILNAITTDLDNDGDLDVISTPTNESKFLWYENDGNENFTTHIISEEANYARSITADDIDNDGDIDVIFGSTIDGTILWYENDGNQNFLVNTIITSAGGVRDVLTADVDSDGDIDLISANYSANATVWYENDGNQVFTARIISDEVAGVRAVFASDIDNDGDLDVLSASISNGEIVWHENDGNQSYTTHVITSSADGALDVFAADMDGDGDIDVVSASTFNNTIAWYENDGNEGFTSHSIYTFINSPASILSADMDGDGDLDILSASASSDKIYLHTNSGNQSFSTSTIVNDIQNPQFVLAGDVDGDGDLDVLYNSYGHGNISWHENTYNASVTIESPSVNEKGTRFSPALEYMFIADGVVDEPRYLSFSITGSATHEIDYITDGVVSFDGMYGVIEIPAGSRSANLTIPVIDDDYYEFNETVIVSLLDGEYLVDSGKNLAIGVIVSDEFGGDFGDAPYPYPTSYTGGGAAAAADEGTTTGPRLGASIDYESDATPSLNADSDQGDDGISFGSMQVGQLDASITVNVQGFDGKLDAWIDFNGDGNWGGLGEQIFANKDVVVGDNFLTFDVPSWANAGTTYARFRISTEGEKGIEGAITDGEVEDYEVHVNAPDKSIAIFSDKKIISSDENGAFDTFAVDMDGDGDFDILSASQKDSTIKWHENDGNQNFVSHEITSRHTANSVYATDFDRDGDIDVIVAGEHYVGVGWYENDGNQIFTFHYISNPSGVHNLAVVDVDGDGDVDVFAEYWQNRFFALYENDGDDQSFNATLISTGEIGPDIVFSADVDRDGDLDVISGSREGKQIAWYENNGVENFTAHLISIPLDYVNDIYATDIDGDGDLDIFSASSKANAITWFENNGIELFTERTIPTSTNSTNQVLTADINGDGYLDVVASSFASDTVAWYLNDGNENFTEQIITTSSDGAIGVFAADIDSDGDLDIVTASVNDDTIAWYENSYEVEIISSEATLAEEASESLVYTLQINNVKNKAQFLSFEISGTATPDVDYTLSGAASFDGVTGVIEIPAGMNSADLVIHSLDDEVSELNESVTVTLLEGNYQIIGSGFLTHLIVSSEFGIEFGDAPTPYSTLNVENEAAHEDGGLNAPRLGPTISYEANSQPSIDADSDLSDDGVSFSEIRVGQLAAAVTVNIQGSPGKLDAWIDFNGDGNWGNSGEHIFDSQPLTLGDNLLTFDVPSWSSAGETYARFRVSTAGQLGVNGYATDGEVEDYVILIDSPHANGGVFLDQKDIAVDFNGTTNISSADIDGDGDLDILSASTLGDNITWHENDGDENYLTHFVSTEIDSARDVFATDVDGDGDIDILSASYDDDKIAWYENDGSQNFTANVISADANGASSLTAADIDGDGDLDVISASYLDDKIAWYENDGSQNFIAHTISTAANGAKSVTVADVDGDGDMDVISASYLDDKIIWYENDGNQNFTVITVSNRANGAQSVTTADVDGDGDLDILSASYLDDKIAWYENINNQYFTLRTISTTADGANRIAVADVDGDGDIDILSTSYNDKTVAWYENDGNQNFTTNRLSTEVTGASSLLADDIDGDGDLDVLFSSSETSEISWLESTFMASVVSEEGSLFEESNQTLTYSFHLNETVPEPKTLTFKISGSATYEDDYTINGETSFNGILGTVLIPAGLSSADLVITPLDDSLLEFSESVTITILDDKYVLSNQSSTTQFINSSEKGGDFGDAPEPYLTLLGDEGAVHNQAVTGNPRLGGTIDYELNGHPSALADADVSDDGVSFGTIRIGQLDATITVDVQEGSGKLNAWIDFDGDGTWDGPGEQILVNQDATVGLSEFQISIPYNAISGTTYARFRISSDGSLGPGGLAANGEVEDYLIEILSPSRTVGFFPEEILLFEGEDYVPLDFVVIDFDNDNDNDIVVSAYKDSDYQVIWYENAGDGSYSAHSFLVQDSIRDIQVGDLDNDGDKDIIYLDNGINWLENDGSQQFTNHSLSTVFAQGYDDVAIADFNRDGILDIAASSVSGITLLMNHGTSGFEERYTFISGTDPLYLDVNDIDSDGDVDVMYGGNSIFSDTEWLSNDGNGFLTQEDFTIPPFNELPSSSVGIIFDLDGDGDKDVLADFAGDFEWYENVDGEYQQRDELESTAPEDFIVSDLDGDGDFDIAAVFDRSEESILWYENTGLEYRRHVISNDMGYLDGINVGVLDGSGAMSLVVSSTSHDSLFIFSPNLLAQVTSHPESVLESSVETLTFRVSIDNSANAPIVVPFGLLGDAIPGIDYAVEGVDSFVDSSGIITIPAGESYADIFIRPIEDGLVELSESITISLNQRDVDDLPLEGQTASASILGDPDAGDYGDAPAPYFTNVIQNGPAHLAAGPTLGATRTTETSGSNSLNANGDLGDDGITFQSLRVGDAGTEIIVNVQNAPEGAMLDGWIDFNIDGSWRGFGERIFSSMPVVIGDNLLTFAIPGDARPGTTYARFRLSTEGGLGDIGNAADGEVEDYEIFIEPPSEGWSRFAANELPSISSFASTIVTVDFDQDGDIDIFTASLIEPIEYLENDGTGQFTRHEIYTDADIGRIREMVIEDIDGDGDLDIGIASTDFTNGGILYYKNFGNLQFELQYIAISSAFGGLDWASIHSADIDGDGDIDFLSTSVNDSIFSDSGGELSWHENTSDGTFITHSVESNFEIGPTNAEAVDLDGDGDLDILTNNDNYNSAIWYENNGNQQFTLHLISAGTEQIQLRGRRDNGFVRSADLDGDGDLDVMPTAGEYHLSPLYWYENQGGTFVQHLLADNNFSYAEEAIPADMDGDGDLDLIYNVTSFGVGLNLYFENRIVGDYNDDGFVDTNDHAFWAVHYGDTTGVGLQADGNGDGTVDAADYTLWRDRLGKSPEQVFVRLTNVLDFGTRRFAQVADLNNDGALDFVGRNYWYANVPAVTVTQQGNLLSEVDENSIDFTFSITLPSSKDTELQIELSGPALAGVDYSIMGADSVSSSAILLTIPAGSTTASLTITSIDDSIFELEEYFTFIVKPTLEYAVVDVPAEHTIAGANQFNVNIVSDEFGGDFGDVPAPYPNLFEANGARHSRLTDNDIQLGPLRATNADGNPSVDAAGDLTDDGVIFGGIQVGQLGATITVDIQGSNGYLDAWIDFNNDGTWNGLGERIFVGKPVIVGSNTLTFDVPSDAISGEVFVRVRVNSQGAIGLTGLAGDGEVEDYLVTIDPPKPIEIGQLAINQIADDVNSPRGIFLIDIDQDGDIDLVSASSGNDVIAWYENDGASNFSRHIITTLADGARSVIAGDLDNDGDIDIAAVSANDDELYWYRNDGEQNFTRLYISSSSDTPNTVYAADVNADGYLDFLTSSSTDGEIAWYENQQNGTFTRQIITADADDARSVYAIDIDYDGDIDVLSASNDDDTIAWYENDGEQNFTKLIIAEDADGATHVSVGDLDDDGDMDVLSASYADDRIAWYENDGSQNFTTHTITNEADGSRSARPFDYDGDGDLDVLSASSLNDTIAWYENDGDANFTSHIITTLADGAIDALAADINGDGILNIVSVSSTGNRIDWYENHLPGDYNRDGLVGNADHAFWSTHYGAADQPGLQADGNGDGVVDAADYTILRDLITSHVPGDYNRDSLVDNGDYDFWRDQYGSTESLGLQADGNGDGVVDAADYTVWRDLYETIAAESAIGTESVAIATQSFHPLARSTEIASQSMVVVTTVSEDRTSIADEAFSVESDSLLAPGSMLWRSADMDASIPSTSADFIIISNGLNFEKDDLLLIVLNDVTSDIGSNDNYEELRIADREEEASQYGDDLHELAFAELYEE